MARASAHPQVGGRLLGALSLLLMTRPALAGGIARTTVERAQEACPDQCVVWPHNGASAVDLSHLDDLAFNLTLGNGSNPNMEWSFNWCRPRPSKICPAHGDTRGFVFVKSIGEKCRTTDWFFQELTQTSTSDDRITLRYTDTSSNTEGKMVIVNLFCDHSLPMHVAKPTDGRIDSNWPASPEILTVDFYAKIACKVIPAPVPPTPVAPVPPSPSNCRFYPQNGGNQIDLSVLKNWAMITTQGGNKNRAFWEINWCIPKVSTRCKSIWSKPGYIFQSVTEAPECNTGNWIFEKFLQVEGGNGDPIIVTYEDTYHQEGGKKGGTFTFSIQCDEGGSLDTITTLVEPPHINDNYPSLPERLTVLARGKIACKNAFP